MKRNNAITLLLITGVIWSTGGFIIKLIPWSPFAIAGLRSGIAFIILYFFAKPKSFSFNYYTKLGAFFYVLMVVCFVFGNKMTSAGNVILIQYAAPIYVALFGFYFLKEKSSKVDWLALVVIFSGLCFFFLEEISADQLKGKLMAFLSGVGFAGLTICMRKEKNQSPIHSVLIGNFLTFFICSPSYFNGLSSSLESWSLLIFLGIVQLGFSYILYSTAIKYVTALDAIIYPVIEPIINPLLAFLILGELMTGKAIFGGSLVLIGVVGRGVIKSNKGEYF